VPDNMEVLGFAPLKRMISGILSLTSLLYVFLGILKLYRLAPT